MSTATGTAMIERRIDRFIRRRRTISRVGPRICRGRGPPARSRQMEQPAKLDPDLIKQCFELGLMAIESPEEYGGAGSTIFNAILAIEELARVDAIVSVFVDVHNTLVTNAFMRWANDEQKKKYLPQMAERQGRCLRIVRGRLGLGRVRPENPCGR